MDKLPGSIYIGLELIKKGEYFDAHEVIEDAWRNEPREIRQLYQGILQVAVIYLHISRGNIFGAQKMLHRALNNLSPFTDHQSLDIPDVINNLKVIQSQMSGKDASQGSTLDPSLLKPVKLRQ